MTTKQFLECAEVAFADLKITATKDQIVQVAEYFEQSVENEHDICRLHVSSPKKTCKCESYKTEIKRLENFLRIHEKNVQNRRNCNNVWVDTNSETVNFE
jgi:hypothetical protein